MSVLDTILRESALQKLRFEVLHAELANLKRRIQNLPAAIAEEVAAQSAANLPPEQSKHRAES